MRARGGELSDEGEGGGGVGNPRGHLKSLLPIEIDRRSSKEAPSKEEEDGEQENIPPDNNGGRI